MSQHFCALPSITRTAGCDNVPSVDSHDGAVVMTVMLYCFVLFNFSTKRVKESCLHVPDDVAVADEVHVEVEAQCAKLCRRSIGDEVAKPARCMMAGLLSEPRGGGDP